MGNQESSMYLKTFICRGRGEDLAVRAQAAVQNPSLFPKLALEACMRP